MEGQRTVDGGTYEKFTWTIKNFSRLNAKKLYSETFIIGSFQWRILLFPNGNNVDYLSTYLDVVDASHLPQGWVRSAKFNLVLVNQVNSGLTIRKETQHQFNAREKDWGFTSFILLSELHDPSRGFLVNDTCIIDAEVSAGKSGPTNLKDQATGEIPLKSDGLTGQIKVKPPQQEDQGPYVTPAAPLSAQVCNEPIGLADNPSLSKGISSTPTNELMDFRGLGQIEEVFVPLLEEVCLQYPSLIECQQKRSRRFVEWAFTALGRVLHFLKNKKVKDMNDDTCNELHNLWEELQTFRFDLTWLEPHVQSALGLKSYLERAMQVKMLKENLASLEMEMKRLTAKLSAAEVDLEIAKRELAKATEGFEERDIEVELGYGRR